MEAIIIRLDHRQENIILVLNDMKQMLAKMHNLVQDSSIVNLETKAPKYNPPNSPLVTPSVIQNVLATISNVLTHYPCSLIWTFESSGTRITTSPSTPIASELATITPSPFSPSDHDHLNSVLVEQHHTLAAMSAIPAIPGSSAPCLQGLYSNPVLWAWKAALPHLT